MFALLGARPAPRTRKSGWAGPVVFLVILAVLIANTSHKTGGAPARSPASAARMGEPAGAAAAIAFTKSAARAGCPYAWGGTGPCSAGYDCSGLLMEAYAQAGVTIPRTTQGMWAGLPHVPMSDLKPGDLILYTGALQPGESPPGHVVMYIGGGYIVQAYGTGYPVAVSKGIPPGAWGAVSPD
jgi:peptidoglycan DL-endopeptidase CwlO